MANQPTKYSKFLVGAASAALVATAVAPVASAAEFSDVKGNTHEAGINALSAAGVITGYQDGTFKPNKTLTRNDVVKLLGKWLVNSKGYKVPTDYKTNPRFKDQTSSTNDELLKYSAVVKDNGVFNGKENGTLAATEDITRENMALVLVRAYDTVNKTDLVKFVAEQKDFKKDVTDLAKAKAEARPYIDVLDYFDITNPVAPEFRPKETTTRGQFATFLNKTSEVKVTPVVTTATKVASVTATNLVEVVIAFDGTVDKVTASDKENYEIAGKVIKSAVPSADLKSVTLTIDTPFVNQAEYKLTFSNVKAGDKEISVKDYKFTPVDTTLPTVESVTALGNQTLSVKFSEPIQSANTSNFTIDGKTVVGSTTISGRTVIVKLYTALEDGEHTVSVKDVVDFNSTKSLDVEQKFTVVKDVTAPTIDSVVSATFEKVTVKFSEQVDPATVTATSVYWLQGTTKKYPNANGVTQISEDTFEFDFSNNKIQYTTDLYITGVKDYSNNVIAADAKIQVNPVIDQTRPEVTSLVYDAAQKSFTVKFNKAVDKASAEKAANYVVKNAAGDVVSKFKTPTLNASNNKEVKVQLVDGLSAGKTYTVEVAGVSDNTTLKNVMMPFTKTVTVADISEPTVNSVVRNSTNNTLVVNFNKKMAVNGDGSIVDKAKYFYTTDGTTWKALPAGASINVSPDGKSAIIQLPTTEVLVANIQKLRVQLVKDDKNNYLNNLTQDPVVSNQTAVTYTAATATDNNKIELTVSRALLANTVNANDFVVKTATTTLNVASASLNANGTKVILTLVDANLLTDDAKFGTNPVSVDVKANATTSTVDGTNLSAGTQTVSDAIAASVKTVIGGTNGDFIDVVFNEVLESSVTNNTTTEATDFIIKDADGVTLSPGAGPGQYSVTVTGSTARINLVTPAVGVYSVAINPRFLEDAATPANLVQEIAAADAISVLVSDTTGPLVAGIANGDLKNSAVTATFTEGVATLSKDGAAANAYTSGTSIPADGSYVLKVTDTTGNVTTINFKIDSAAPLALTNVVNANSFKVVSPTTATVVFNEKLDAATFTATNANGFTVAGGTSALTKAELQADGVTVLLTGTTFVAGTTTIGYTAGPVKDLAGNSLATFTTTATN